MGTPEPTQFTPTWTISEIQDAFENDKFHPANPSTNYFVCDFCSTHVKYTDNPQVGYYVTDSIINTRHPVWKHATKDNPDGTIAPLASYCNECTTKRLLFPCNGYAELRATFTLTKNKKMKNVNITDVSLRDDGIPWNPKEISEKITGVSWKDHQLAAAIHQEEEHFWGPENMVTFFLSVVNGIDIRELVTYDGTINEEKIAEARVKYIKFMETLLTENDTPQERIQQFRDSVRGED